MTEWQEQVDMNMTNLNLVGIWRELYRKYYEILFGGKTIAPSRQDHVSNLGWQGISDHSLTTVSLATEQEGMRVLLR